MAFGAVAVDTLLLHSSALSYARRPPPQLTSSFLAACWNVRRRHRHRPASSPSLVKKKQQQGRSRRRGGLLLVVDEFAGQYDEGFEDVHVQLINYFTYKAVRTVLHQLYEMNPPSYVWLYNFVVNNKPTDGKRFLRALAKEKQNLAERVMITRLHLYGKWIKVDLSMLLNWECDSGQPGSKRFFIYY